MFYILTGLSCENIKLEIGMDMTGYLGRVSGSTGIHDQLKIKCIVLDDGKSRVAYVVCDLLGLDNEFVKETAKFTGVITSIPAENIIIACTHTHSGPASIFLRNCGEVNSEWLKELKFSIAQCVKNAVNNLEPSYLSYNTGSCDINANRDTMDEVDTVRLRDNQLGLLTLYSAHNNEIKAMFVNYACHPTVLLDNNLLFSADFPYYLEVSLKKKVSDDLLVIYTNGCCGNLGPIKCGSFEAAEELGNRLANDVYNLLKSGQSNIDFNNVSISVKNNVYKIPLNHNLDEEELNRLKKEYTGNLNNEIISNKNGIMVKVYSTFVEWAEDMLLKVRNNMLSDSITAEMKLMEIGELKIFNFPFELFHDIGLKIKNHFGLSNTMVVGYANGNFGYFPSKELYNHGYYETWDSYKYYGSPGPISENAEEIIFNAISSLGD